MARSQNTQAAEMERRIHACEETMRILLAAEDAQSARIAEMLHDNVGQYLAVLQLGFRGLERELDTGADVKVTLRSLHAISQSVGEELHKVALELRPTSLDDHGLAHSLTTFLSEWSLIAKTAVHFDHVALGESRLPRHLETNLFRVIREMLRVVSRQTDVTDVSVILQRQQGYIVSVVEHNGRSPDVVSDHESRDAIAAIKARVSLLDGTFTFEDGVPRGHTMIARVPDNREG